MIKKRIPSIVMVVTLTLLLVLSLTACATGKCFMCNQSGFFRKTVTVGGVEAKICNDCYKTYSETMESAGLSEAGNSSMPWWGWTLIIFLGLGVISVVYKGITKRDLAEDIDRLTDKLDEDEE